MSFDEKQLEQSLKFLIANTVNDALTMGLSDDLGASVIHTNSSIPWHLILSITNKLVENVEIVGQPGPASETHFHFRLKFVDNALYTTSDITVTDPNWLIYVKKDTHFYITDICLLRKENITLTPASSTEVRLGYNDVILRSRTEAALQVAVTVGQHVVTINGTEPVTGTETVHLTHYTDADAPSPLVASLVQPRTILNDGSLARDLHLRLVNTSADPITFAPPANLGGPTATAIQLSVDVDDVAAWALCKTDEAALISIAPPDHWTKVSEVIGNGRKTWVFRPEYDKITKIEPNSVVEFHLTGVKTTLPPGFTNLYVSLIEFPLYGTQTSICQIEKSPLVYNAGLNTGLLSTGATGTNHGLALKGNTTEDLLLVDQAGTGYSAHFIGAAGVKIDQHLEVHGTINSQGLLTTAGLTSSSDVKVDGGLNVSQHSTLNGAVEVGSSLKVHGTAEFQELKVHGTAETLEQRVHGRAIVASLEVSGETKLNGYLDAKSGANIAGPFKLQGPTEIFGRYFSMTTNTHYVASTDGIVSAFVDGGVPANGFCCVRIFGYVDEYRVAHAMGGNIGTFKIHSESDFQPCMTANLGAITFPVPKGAAWRVDRLDDHDNQSSTSVIVNWMPLSRTVWEEGSELVATDTPIHPSKPQNYESDVETSISDLVSDLGCVFGHDFSDEEKKRLEERVYKLVQKQASPKPANYDSALSNLVDVLEGVLKQCFTEQEKLDLTRAVKQLL